MSSVSSMEPVGITKAWTSVVVPKRSRMMVTVQSSMKPRGCSGLAGGGAGAFFTSATVTAFFCSTATYCSESLIFCGKCSATRDQIEHRRKQLRAGFGEASPPSAGGVGILLYDLRRGGAGADEDRGQPHHASRCAGHGDEFAVNGRLLPVRPFHAAVSAGAEVWRAIPALPGDCAHLRVGDGALVCDLT